MTEGHLRVAEIFENENEIILVKLFFIQNSSDIPEHILASGAFQK